MIATLDDLEEKRGAILNRLGEDLKEVTLVIVVDKDLVALQNIDIFGHLEVGADETFAKLVVISVRDLLEELDAASLHSLDSLDDALCAHSDVLDAGATVVVAELLDLTLLHAVCGLIDWHLDLLIEVDHND